MNMMTYMNKHGYFHNNHAPHQLRPREPLCGVGVETDDVFAGRVRGEGPAALAAVHLG